MTVPIQGCHASLVQIPLWASLHLVSSEHILMQGFSVFFAMCSCARLAQGCKARSSVSTQLYGRCIWDLPMLCRRVRILPCDYLTFTTITTTACDHVLWITIARHQNGQRHSPRCPCQLVFFPSLDRNLMFDTPLYWWHPAMSLTVQHHQLQFHGLNQWRFIKNFLLCFHEIRMRSNSSHDSTLCLRYGESSPKRFLSHMDTI